MTPTRIELPNVSACALVDLNFVRVCRRVNAESVLQMVDDGRLLWTWNVSAGASAAKRELRFWLPSVITPQFCARLTLDDVLARILPTSRKFFHSGEICESFLINRVTLAIIAREIRAPMKDRSFQISRDALAGWLRARWLGGEA